MIEEGSLHCCQHHERRGHYCLEPLFQIHWVAESSSPFSYLAVQPFLSAIILLANFMSDEAMHVLADKHSLHQTSFLHHGN